MPTSFARRIGALVTPAALASARPRRGRGGLLVRRASTVDGERLSPEAASSNGVTGVNVDAEDVLEVEFIRDQLSASESPFMFDNNGGIGFVSDDDRVLLNSLHFGAPDSAGSTCRAGMMADDGTCLPLASWAYRAGPRATIYREPHTVKAAIVTCGGLCPGLNDVVRQLVITLEDYGVGKGLGEESSEVLAVHYGFGGFFDEDDKPPTRLTRAHVEGIQLMGGTLLGTSRGGSDVVKITEKLKEMGVNMLFVVGGNGGNAGANAINKECQKQGVCCSVIGIPKSIDNDILLIDKCFGYDTAVQEAVRAILAAKVEASSARNGVGVVKLMGRQSGFIAMAASMASGEVDLCLIPETPFVLDGPSGALPHLMRRVKEKGHAVVVVAEGAGQDILGQEGETDPSGNPILKDVGPWFRDSVKDYFKSSGSRADVKYIDPSYMIRSVPTIPSDKIYCQVLAQNAVHAAFAGMTGVTVGLVNTHYVYLPIPTVIQAPRIVDIRGRMWNRLLTMTKQPAWGTLLSADPVSSHMDL